MMNLELNRLEQEVFSNRLDYHDVKYPIYILSKGRAGNVSSYNNLKDMAPTIFVELATG